MGWGELQGAFHNNILKFCIQFSNKITRKGFGEPQHGQISDIAQGVENFIIVENPVYCLLSRTGSVYKAQVIFGDESLFNHNRTYKVYPTVPIVVVFMIQEDNGAGHAFPGLKQGEVLESFVQSSESPRQ